MARTFAGGIWFTQLTFNELDRTWHPHLHVMLDGAFTPQKTLASTWHAVTVTSKILDIRVVKSTKDAARYVSRYVTRPIRLTDLPESQYLAVKIAFASRRTYGAFGTARTAKVLIKPTFDSTDWARIGNWSTVTALMPSLPAARAIYRAWITGRPLTQPYDLIMIDHAIDWDAGNLDRAPPSLPFWHLYGDHRNGQ